MEEEKTKAIMEFDAPLSIQGELIAQKYFGVDEGREEIECKDHEILQLRVLVEEKCLDLYNVNADLEDAKKTIVALNEKIVKLRKALDIQQSIDKLSIEHELRGDQLTFAFSELKESLESRMPVKRQVKKDTKHIDVSKKKKKIELNLV